MNDTKMDEEKYKIARKRVEEIKGFYGHLFAYIGVNITLVIIDLVVSPYSMWFYWITVFWGIGVSWHALGVFVFNRFPGAGWEKRKMEEIIKEMDKIK